MPFVVRRAPFDGLRANGWLPFVVRRVPFDGLRANGWLAFVVSRELVERSNHQLPFL